MSVVRPTYLFPFNSHYVAYLINLIRSGQDQRGVLLENLMSYLIRTVPGLEPARRLIIKGGEIDLLVRNYRPFVEPLRWLEDYFLVECKDQSRRVNEKENIEMWKLW